MSEFRPMFTGFAPSFAPTELPARTTETTPMSIIADNAERILKLIREHGGSITGAQLREAIDSLDMDLPDLRSAIARLSKDKRIRVVGATRNITYHVAGKASKAASAANAPLPVVEPAGREQAEQKADRPFTQRSAELDVGSDTAVGHPDVVYLSVPMAHGVPAEVQLIAALDFISQHFVAVVDDQALGRAATWLASKHRTAA